MTLKSPLEQAYDVIEYYFKQELEGNGILSDVNTFLTSANNKEHIDAPVIWIEKETITSSYAQHSDSSLIDIPVNIVCCAEVEDDFQTAENASMNLASRCITSLFRNVKKPADLGKHITLRGFTIQSIDPNGTFEIINKTTLLPATRLQLTFHISLNWMIYTDTEETDEINYEDEGVIENITITDITIN